ncbi:MAG: DUF72 domain-containing protein [Leptolyngbya sp. SIO4C1]|nr:DUF72 domain-containing protein [Leptolyngbya sp. SIO4C1]
MTSRQQAADRTQIGGQFWLGCAVWAYKDWVGRFYPPGSRAKDFLQRYGERLTAVEGNTTFYHVPTPATVARWAQETPQSFRFCPKLPRSITHTGAVAPQLSAARTFDHLMQGLGPRLGPIFAQLPPSYGPAQWPDLTEFLQGWSAATPLAVEVRHADWFQAPNATRLNALLRQHRAGRVLLDSRPVYDWQQAADDPQRQSQRRKPQVPLQPAITAPFTLVRYIGHPELMRNHRYLTGWVDRVNRALSQGAQVYFFVHCPQEAESPAIAGYFQQLLEQAGVAVPPLPSPPSPEQLALF